MTSGKPLWCAKVLPCPGFFGCECLSLLAEMDGVYRSPLRPVSARDSAELRWFLWTVRCRRRRVPRRVGTGSRASGSRLMARSSTGRRRCVSAEELAVLRLLLARAGEIVSPLELKRAVWGEERAPSDIVSKCVASLRARLQPADCIQSVYKRGYRLSAAVETDDARPSGDLPRLAVLPFATGYGVPEYLGLALAEETIQQMDGGHYAIASIVARDSVITLARRGASAHEIGKTLQADLVLSGRLEAAAGRHRLAGGDDPRRGWRAALGRRSTCGARPIQGDLLGAGEPLDLPSRSRQRFHLRRCSHRRRARDASPARRGARAISVRAS